MRAKIRKVFIDGANAGASSEYWENEWEGTVLAVDKATQRLLRDHVPSRSLVLEAGCGQAEFASDLSHSGHHVVGIDLAKRALAAASVRHPELPLAVGDVGRMPFQNETFDAVVSLGVVEHLEAGPADLLSEHARVLKSDGVLLLTVPMRNWYRRWTDMLSLVRRKDSYRQHGRRVKVVSETGAQSLHGSSFHQYEFSPSTAISMCETAGFEVNHWQPFGVAWAIGESPLMRKLYAHTTLSSGASLSSEISDGDPSWQPSSSFQHKLKDYLRQPFIYQAAGDPLQGAIGWISSRLFGHMQFLMATRKEESQ